MTPSQGTYRFAGTMTRGSPGRESGKRAGVIERLAARFTTESANGNAWSGARSESPSREPCTTTPFHPGEANSALDTESEKAVKRIWIKCKEPNLHLLIAHRLSTSRTPT